MAPAWLTETMEANSQPISKCALRQTDSFYGRKIPLPYFETSPTQPGVFHISEIIKRRNVWDTMPARSRKGFVCF